MVVSVVVGGLVSGGVGASGAATPPAPATSSPAIATTLAAFSFHPVMQILSFPWMGLATGNPVAQSEPGRRSPLWLTLGMSDERARHEGPDVTGPKEKPT